MLVASRAPSPSLNQLYLSDRLDQPINQPRRPKLIAKWVQEDNKLVCRWISL
jgi:hypothetical protein